MTDPAYVETGLQAESLKEDVTPDNKKVYFALVVSLGAALVIGVLGWLALAFVGKTMPEGLTVIIGAISGGLVGLISGKKG